MYHAGDLTADVRKPCVTHTYCGHWKHCQLPSVVSLPNGEPPGYHFWRSEVQHQGMITVFPPLEARAFFACSCSTPNQVPDFILPSVLCLPPLTLTSELTFGRSSKAPCPAQSAGDPKCSHLCKTLQVKLYSQVLRGGTGTTPLPAASKCSCLLSYCSSVVGSPLCFYKHPNTFSLLFYPPLGGISCFPLPYSVPKNDVIWLIG